jgi:hypothetical protein
MAQIKNSTLEIVKEAYDYRLDDAQAREAIATLFDLLNLLYRVHRRQENDRHDSVDVKG